MINSRPKKPCSKLGCPALVSAPERYCDKHKPVEGTDRSYRNKAYDEGRKQSIYWRFYKTAEWLAARAAALRRDLGMCQDCKAQGKIVLADMVHHEETIKKRWDLRLKLSNLISLCDACHYKRDHK